MGYVYIIRAKDTSMYKIGISGATDKRLKGLQSGSPLPLNVIHANWHDNEREIERLLHTTFAQCRSHNEWFSLSDNELFKAKKIIGFPPPPQQEKIKASPGQQKRILEFVYQDEYDIYDLVLSVWEVDLRKLDYLERGMVLSGYVKYITGVIRRKGK